MVRVSRLVIAVLVAPLGTLPASYMLAVVLHVLQFWTVARILFVAALLVEVAVLPVAVRLGAHGDASLPLSLKLGAAVGGGAGLLVALPVFSLLQPEYGIGVIALGLACGILCAGLFWSVALWTPESVSKAESPGRPSA